jgi:hypothetical protein
MLDSTNFSAWFANRFHSSDWLTLNLALSFRWLERISDSLLLFNPSSSSSYCIASSPTSTLLVAAPSGWCRGPSKSLLQLFRCLWRKGAGRCLRTLVIIVLYVICFYPLNVLRITAISYVNKFIYALKRWEVSTAGSCCLGSVWITKGKWCLTWRYIGISR